MIFRIEAGEQVYMPILQPFGLGGHDVLEFVKRPQDMSWPLGSRQGSGQIIRGRSNGFPVCRGYIRNIGVRTLPYRQILMLPAELTIRSGLGSPALVQMPGDPLGQSECFTVPQPDQPFVVHVDLRDSVRPVGDLRYVVNTGPKVSRRAASTSSMPAVTPRA